MVDHINCLESHEPCVFIAEFCAICVLNGFNYLVIESLVHGCGIFDDLSCFYICLIGLLAVSDFGICSDRWDCTRLVCIFSWCSHCQ